jgi:hypothetical protein
MEKIFKKSELEGLFKKGIWDVFGDQIEEQKKLYKGLIKKYPFDVDSTESIYQQKKQKFLFHITPLVNLEKIKNIGLTPKTNSKLAYHPERVYFLKNIENENFIKNFIGKLFVNNKNNIELKEKYVVLRIDLDKELKTEIKPKIRFFADPNMSGAVYTLENISPNSIEPVKLATIEFVDDDMLGFKIELTDF